MCDIEKRLAALEQQVGELEDINAIRRLHWAYGYYIDFNRAEDVAELFANDGEVVFLSGEYLGQRRRAAALRHMVPEPVSRKAKTGRLTASCSIISRCRTSLPSRPTARPPRGAFAACCLAAAMKAANTNPKACRSSSWKPGFTRMIMSAKTACGRSSGSII